MKRDKKADEAAVIDLNDSLVGSAKGRLHVDDVAKAIAKAAQEKPDFTGLDKLYKDDGTARRDFEGIATGYLVDRYQLSGKALNRSKQELMNNAIHYLSAHPQQFDDWQR